LCHLNSRQYAPAGLRTKVPGGQPGRPLSDYTSTVTYPEDPARTEQARQAAQAETDKVLAGLDEPRLDLVTVTAVHGFPVEELVNAGKDADMIVLGSRGAGGFTRLMMGSVAGQVAQHAHCPVLLIPPENRS
jgi:nucleotide-binding universal stress UspA family protein